MTRAPLRLIPLEYPERLRAHPRPPTELWLSRPLAPRSVIAVVGTRHPLPEAAAFARSLAAEIATAGAVVASGRAVGIDTAAHEGALDAGGETWVVAPTGHEHVFPPANAPLFRAVAEGAGAMIWPFPPGTPPRRAGFLARNGVLVALADALVVVQAGHRSGALNAASWARRLGRPVHVVVAPPWMTGFEGCAAELARGARPVVGMRELVRELGLSPDAPQAPQALRADAAPPQAAAPEAPRSAAEHAVLAAITSCEAPAVHRAAHAALHLGVHVDEIRAKAGLTPAELATALLTLRLEHVLVEGPDGFYRKRAP